MQTAAVAMATRFCRLNIPLHQPRHLASPTTGPTFRRELSHTPVDSEGQKGSHSVRNRGYLEGVADGPEQRYGAAERFELPTYHYEIGEMSGHAPEPGW